MMKNLIQVVLSTAALPITVLVDTFMLPIDAENIHKTAYSRTDALITNIAERFDEAVKN